MKNKNILKSNSAFMLITYGTTSNEEHAKIFTLIKNYNFSFNSNRQTSKQLGSQNYAVNDLVKKPDVNLTIDYHFSPYLINEFLMGFKGNQTTAINAFSNLKEYDGGRNNFYCFINNNDGQDAFDALKKWDSTKLGNIDFSGYDVLSFSEGYLKTYNLSFKQNEIPSASVTYLCSNMKMDRISNQTTITSPTVVYNSSNNYYYQPRYLNISSNNFNTGFDPTWPNSQRNFIIGDPEGRTSYNPPVALSYNSNFLITNLSDNTNPLKSFSTPILQSLDIDFNFDRVDLNQLGTDFVSNRKLQYPVNGEIKIQALVSGFNSGNNQQLNFDTLFYNNDNYNIDINFSNKMKNVTGFYQFQNAKLNNFDYSMSSNNILNFNASFSVNITTSTGFSISKIQK